MTESENTPRASAKPEAPETRRPWYARTRILFLALLIGVVYSYGWRVTEIDIGELVRDVHLVKPLIRDLLQPDLMRPDTETLTVETGFYLADGFSSVRPQEKSDAAAPALMLSRREGRVGDALRVEGVRLPPDSQGVLYWVNAIEQEFPLGKFTTGGEGAFALDVVVPESARGNPQILRAVLTRKTGVWSVSPTLKLTLEKMVETLFLALMATTLAVLVAAPLSFLGARNLMTRRIPTTVVYYGVRTVFNVLRSIEPLIMAILFAVWVGIGPFAGVLALGVHSIAALGKLFSEQIESIDPGPIEAIQATGATPAQVVLYAVVPQVAPQFLALSFYRWDINVRMSTIIGFVGGGGIGFLLQQWINLLQYRQAGTALFAIAIVVIVLDTVSAKVRARIDA